MVTIKLQVSEKVLGKVLTLLKQFTKEEVQVIQESASFEEDKQYVEEAYQRLQSGKAKMYSIEELEQKLSQTIQK